MITVGVKIRTTRVFFDTGGFLPCRVLSEDDPKEKSELRTNGASTLNENDRGEEIHMKQWKNHTIIQNLSYCVRMTKHSYRT